MGAGLGVGGIVIAALAYFLGLDPETAINVADELAPQRETEVVPKGAPTDEMGQFISKVLGSTEDVWTGILTSSNSSYSAPTLVLYEDTVRTACGTGQAVMGPFYCAEDETLYIDLTFFRDLRIRFGAPGDFAQAYVVAHEVGHHVQKLTGALGAQSNAASVRVELQADCYAGVWGHYAGAMNQLEPGDIAEALNAATAIGDDRLQQQSGGRVVPESFTHGSSAQRVRWFTRGLDSGQPGDCDTSTTL